MAEFLVVESEMPSHPMLNFFDYQSHSTQPLPHLVHFLQIRFSHLVQIIVSNPVFRHYILEMKFYCHRSYLLLQRHYHLVYYTL